MLWMFPPAVVAAFASSGAPARVLMPVRYSASHGVWNGSASSPSGHTTRSTSSSSTGPVASPCAWAIAPAVRWSKYPDGPLPCTAPIRIVPAGVVGNAGTRTNTRAVTAGAAAGSGRRHRPVRMVSIAAATVKTIRKVSPLTPTQDTV